ncbi:hypothetical protein [Flavobacterium tructae]|uniref:IS1/IS1595 family N-terminal zinc-binding domain-containing protein n=1 Tax=Flavobacterium tructae TaxID=1114873 RepID=UPI0035A851C2
MSKNPTLRSRVSDEMNCPKCKEKKVIKNGRTKNNKQQYYCKICSHRFIENYANQAYKLDINQKIVQLTKERLDIRSTARILEISATTLLERIVLIARSITHAWSDTYDWHPGASAYIPGFGNINDSDAKLVEKYCGAKPFEMQGAWKQSFNKSYELGFLGGLNVNLEKKMKKKIILVVVLSIVLFSVYYYWNNKYVNLYPVNLEHEEYIVNTNKIPNDFYKKMELVLNNYNEDYIVKNNIILIKNKKMNDLELIYNYTKKSNDSIWLSTIKR